MKMFDYSVKIKVILIGALAVLIIFLFFLISYNNSYSNDLDRVSKVREISIGLEYYFDKNHAYPESISMDLDAIKVITENGVNQVGDHLYFSAPPKNTEGTLISDKDNYIIEFELDNSWELWGINTNDGGICNISNNSKMLCRDKN